MSHDYNLILDTSITPAQLMEHLRGALGLAAGGNDTLSDPSVLVAVRAATPRSAHLAEPGIARPTMVVTFMPNARTVGADAAVTRTHQLAAAVMRFCPGDAAFTYQEETTSILRLGDTIHVDPSQVGARLLPAEAFAPAKVVSGMPAEPVR